jgi:YozE SAM-like fold
MSPNASGRLQEPAQTLIHDHHDENRSQPTSFTTWLRAQKARPDIVGHLATDIAGDGGWPEPATLQEMHQYLEKFNAIPIVHTALDDAWAEWSS